MSKDGMKTEKAQRVLTLVKCCLCFGCSVGLVNDCLGIFTSSVTKELGIGVASFSLMITIVNITNALMTTVMAQLMKRIDIRWLMSCGVLLCAGSLGAMSFFSAIAEFYVAAVFLGIGLCLFSTLPVTSVIQSWYGMKSGFATGIAMSCSGILGAICNPLCSVVIGSYGYQACLRFVSMLFIVLALPGAGTMRMGKAKILAETVIAPGHSSGNLGSGMLVYLSILMVSVMFLGSLGSHVSVIGVDAGYELTFAALMVSMTMIANVVSKVLLGFLADRIGSVKAMAACLCTSLAGFILLLFFIAVPSVALAGSLLYGMSAASYTVGISLITQWSVREKYTEVFSKITAIGSGSFAMFVSLHGVLRDMTGSYSLSLGMALGLNAFAILLCLALPFARKRFVKRR